MKTSERRLCVYLVRDSSPATRRDETRRDYEMSCPAEVHPKDGRTDDPKSQAASNNDRVFNNSDDVREVSLQ
jgi:hypothetical protein